MNDDDLTVEEYVDLTERQDELYKEIRRGILKYIEFLYDERGITGKEIRERVKDIGLHVFDSRYTITE